MMSDASRDRMSPRIYPWWLILVGFVIGVFVTLVVTQSRPQTGVVYQPQNMQDILLQATQLVRYGTMTAQVGYARIEPLDPLLATAAALSTQTSFGDQLQAGVDPLLQTATAIVIQATQQAPSG